MPRFFFDTDVSWYDHFIGMAIGLFVLVTVAYFVEKAFGKESLGGGDVKLTAVCGLFLGWQKLILMMLIASVAGSIVLILLKRRKRNTDKIPFAPFLTAGFVFSMFFGSFIIEWYISLF